MSASFTALLDVVLALLAAKQLWVTFSVVGMDSAQCIDRNEGVDCHALKEGNASDFNLCLEFTVMEGHDEPLLTT